VEHDHCRVRDLPTPGCRGARSALRADTDTRKEIRRFFEARVKISDTKRYLRKLERRKQAGAKLLRIA
jgi:hypothetical protein